MGYEDIVDRTGTSRTAREIPETVASGIIKEVVEESAMLRLGNVFRMPAYQHRIRVLKAFADAFWLDGVNQAAKDSALKQTTNVQWDNVYLTTEEMAVLVPVPDAWMADSDLAWEEIRSEVKRAFAKKIDLAMLYDQGNTPATMGNGLYANAVAAGNTLTEGASTMSNGDPSDFADDLAHLAQNAEEDGYTVGGFVTGPATKWRLTRLRDANGVPIYDPSFDGGRGGIYGRSLGEVKNGAWDSTRASVLTGEFDKLIIGVRQDITFDVFDQGIIQDENGDIVYNAMQQDGKVLRAVMRIGYTVPNPVKVLGGTYPFYVLRPSGAPAS